jgi:membrane-bound metal-dependent hydrolase YbcI (DUF457 family)
MSRLIIAASVFTIWCLLFAIIWFQDLALQSMMLAILIVLTLFILGRAQLIAQVKLLWPFIAMLILIYALFILLGIDPAGDGALSYWLAYGLPRVLLLMNALLAFRLCFALVSVDSLLHSRISIHKLKYIILAKILYDAAVHSHQQLKQWQNYVPSMRLQQRGMRARFKAGLSTVLALVLYILAEAEIKGERIDNLLANCHTESPAKPGAVNNSNL